LAGETSLDGSLVGTRGIPMTGSWSLAAVQIPVEAVRAEVGAIGGVPDLIEGDGSQKGANAHLNPPSLTVRSNPDGDAMKKRQPSKTVSQFRTQQNCY
jgi:hypothetical protein